MKLTSAVILAFIAASALANSVPSGHPVVFARDLYERDSGKGFLESFDRRGGGIGSSLFKSFAGASGNTGSRVASNSVQYGVSQSISGSSSTQSSQSTQKHTQHHSRRHWRQHLPQSPPQPCSLEECMMRRAWSRPTAHLESFEKCKKGKADSTPSLFKSTAGAAPPPPLPLTRRALFPVARSRSSSGFAPIRRIKNAFNRTSQGTARVYRKSAPARKKGKAALISLMDGISKGITG